MLSSGMKAGQPPAMKPEKPDGRRCFFAWYYASWPITPMNIHELVRYIYNIYIYIINIYHEQASMNFSCAWRVTRVLHHGEFRLQVLRISAWSCSTQGRLAASAKMSCSVCEASAISRWFTTSSTSSVAKTMKPTRWCPPSYKWIYKPINYRYITYKP